MAIIDAIRPGDASAARAEMPNHMKLSKMRAVRYFLFQVPIRRNQSVYNSRAERAVSNYDTPHLFNFVTVFELPLGRDKRWLNRRRLVEPQAPLRHFQEIAPRLYLFPAIEPASFRRAAEESIGLRYA